MAPDREAGAGDDRAGTTGSRAGGGSHRLCLEAEDQSGPACAPLLALLAQVQIARGRHGPAERTLDSLDELAGQSGDDRARAFAELATGRVRSAEGDARASSHLQAALEGFSALDLPLEAGRAQLELARALGPRALARGLPKPPSQRPAWRSRPSNAWARSATLTRRATCSGDWEPAGEPGRAGREN